MLLKPRIIRWVSFLNQRNYILTQLSMIDSTLDKCMVLGSKSSIRPTSQYSLVGNFSCREGNGFSIVLNTRIEKEENHYVYGDRLDRILSEVHKFYEPKPQGQGMGRLIKSIRLPLGEEGLKNHRFLKDEVFPKMKQLKQTQVQPDKYSSKITLQVIWKGSSEIKSVKCSYARQYEKQLFSSYNQVRKKFQDKWKEYLKRTGKNLKPKTQSRKRKVSSSMEEDYQQSQNIRKLLKVQEKRNEEVIQLGSQESVEKNRDSTEENQRMNKIKKQDKQPEKKNPVLNKSLSFLAKPMMISIQKPIMMNKSKASSTIQVKTEETSSSQRKYTPNEISKSSKGLGDSIKSKSNPILTQKIKFYQKQVPIVIQIDDD